MLTCLSCTCLGRAAGCALAGGGADADEHVVALVGGRNASVTRLHQTILLTYDTVTYLPSLT